MNTYNKALSVVKSCKTIEHIISCRHWIQRINITELQRSELALELSILRNDLLEDWIYMPNWKAHKAELLGRRANTQV